MSCLLTIPHPSAGAGILTAPQFACAKAAFNAAGKGALANTAKWLTILTALNAASARVHFRRYSPLGSEHRAQLNRIEALAARYFPGKKLTVGKARPGRRARTHMSGTAAKPQLILSHATLALLESLRPADRVAFDGEVLHELAHADTRDLSGFQMARASRTFVIIFTGIYLIVFLIAPSIRSAVTVLQIGVLALTVALLTQAFLRAREFWADARAAAADSTAVEMVLRTAGAVPARKRRSRFRASHPVPEQRLAALRQPSSLLRFPGWYSLAVGFLGGFTLSMFASIVGEVYWGTVRAGDESVAVGYIAGIPVAIALTLGIWRQVWADEFSGRMARTWPHTMNLAAGLFAGRYASPLFSTTGGLFAPYELLPIAAASAVAAIAMIRWSVAVASGWFPRQVRGLAEGAPQDPGRIFLVMRRLGLVVAVLVMGKVLVAWLLFCRFTDGTVVPPYGSPLPPGIPAGGLPMIAHVLRSAAGGLLTPIILTLSWVLPLLPREFLPQYKEVAIDDRYGRKARHQGLIWAVIALLASVTGLKVPSAVRSLAGLGTPIPGRWALVIMAMVLAAVITSFLIRGPLAGPYAMAAAFVAALVGLLSLPFGDTGPIWQAIMDVLSIGQLLAACATLIICGTLRTATGGISRIRAIGTRRHPTSSVGSDSSSASARN